MEFEASKYLEFPQTYWAYAFGIAAAFYGAVNWFGKHHVSENAKETLTLWLWGEYESTWSYHFCNLFDAVFGEKHLSWRCFLRSSIASVTSVLLLYFLFSEIMGVLGEGTRVPGDLTLWKALLLGAAINIFPDYLSLYETRWLLKRFNRVGSIAGQVAVLVADAVFTGAIIWIGISLFQLINGDAPLSVVEIVALFSVFSVFFYSTFLTSVWAWIYCLSTWFMRLFSRSFVSRFLDVEKRPVTQVALVGAVLIFATSFALTPAFRTTTKEQQVTVVDELLCRLFPAEICVHVGRLTSDEKKALNYLARACEGGAIEQCFQTASKYYDGNAAKSLSLFRKACNSEDMKSCWRLGLFYENGHGVAPDYQIALSFYRKACDGRNVGGCIRLATMYEKGKGVDKDDKMAFKLNKRTCDRGGMAGCINLGVKYMKGQGVDRDYKKAASLFKRVCDDEVMSGCVVLGVMYLGGKGVDRDYKKAVELSKRACDGKSMRGCAALGVMYADGRGVDRDYKKAFSLMKRACDGGDMGGCTALGQMYLEGLGVDRDEKKAFSLMKRACDAGHPVLCERLKAAESNAPD